MSQLHSKTISPEQESLLRMLSKANIGILVGGTALALQLGHRRSYDLDFVTNQEVSETDVERIKKTLRDYPLTQRLQMTDQYIAVAGETKITLFQDLAPLLHPVVTYLGAKLASVEDIFSTKLFLLGKRATWRDYCDLAVIIDQQHSTLKTGIAEAVQRYQIAERWILEPLTYFKDIEMTPIDWISREYTPQNIQEILSTETAKYLG